jgi:predicted enzyme related to lactoylglutathione lyase
MSATPSKFVWYDVMTSDTAAAESFYKKVIGWEAKDAGMPGHPYTLFSSGPVMVGGLMPIPEEARAMGARPGWMGYIGVADVDATVVRVQAAGGVLHRPPADIPGVGRFAVMADPHGAAFILFKGASAEQPEQAAPGAPGHIGWHELHAGDGESAFAFYSSLFGWTKVAAIDMGPMGTYQTFATGGEAVGGMMTKVPELPLAMWLYYFNVDAIDAAMERVTQNGGKVLMGPQQVPTGQWIVQCLDPQGAMFALLAAGR